MWTQTHTHSHSHTHTHTLKTNKETIHWLNCIQFRQMNHWNRFIYYLPCVNQFLLLRFYLHKFKALECSGVIFFLPSRYVFRGVNCFVCLLFVYLCFCFWSAKWIRECKCIVVICQDWKGYHAFFSNTNVLHLRKYAYKYAVWVKKRRRRLIFPWKNFKRLHTICFLNLLFAL